MSDYLWDGTGSDPEIEELERLLSPLAYTPETVEEAPQQPQPSTPSNLRIVGLLAAVVLAAVGLRGLFSDTDSWQMTTLDGVSPCGEEACELQVGDWLETDGETRMLLEVADIGTMEVAPDTRLRLKATGENEHRLELASGRVDAVVVAPPRLLIVETPAATAVDLGCAYTLEVDEAGDGSLVVSSGWVALEVEGYAAFVPAGAEAAMSATLGPGTPMFWDAPDALQALNEGGSLTAALDAARVQDTLSLWHLLQTADNKVAVLERIEALVPSSTTSRDALLQGDPKALEALRTTLEPAWL
jgi:ferric-dicitrate binding protein FerR (iron transport regulator)